MSTSPVAAFSEVVDTVTHLVESVRDDQWSAPTPCTEWNVQQLVEHLMVGQRTSTEAMGAEPGVPESDADLAPEALREMFRVSAAALVAAFETPRALERTIQAPIGAVPGAMAMRLLTLDHLAHGWDLARAIGQKALFDDALIEREIEFARGLTAQTPSGPGAPFAPSRTAPDDAPALDRLAALLGRDITA